MASLLLGGAAATPAQTARGAPPKIGSIRKPFADYCNCTLYLPARSRDAEDVALRTVFVSDTDEQAQMNIDGSDVMLRLVSHRARVARPLKVGERSVEEYEGGGARVRINFTVTKVCPPGDETCEMVWQSAVISVTKGGRTRTVKASGECGC